LDKSDIEIMRKAQVYLFVAPTLTMGFVFLLNRLRYELLMSQHFFYLIKKYQEKMQSKYQRKRPAGEKKGASEEQESEMKGSGMDEKNLYKDIKKSKEEADKERLEELQAQMAENRMSQQ
jgi:hypothetical protein